MVMEQVEHVSLVILYKLWNLCEKFKQKHFSNSGPVRVGDPLTLIIYMRSKYGKNNFKIPLQKFLFINSSDGFDIVVNDWWEKFCRKPCDEMH